MPENFSEKTNEELLRWVAQACEGNEAAWRSLYAEIQPQIFAIAKVLAFGKPGILDEDDIVQETWIDLRAGLKTFDPSRAPFRGWLAKVIRHAAKTISRKGARRGRLARMDSIDAEEESRRSLHDALPAVEPTPALMALCRAARETAFDALRHIKNEDYRLTVFARGCLLFSEAEAMEFLEKPAGTIKSNYYRGFKELYQAFVSIFEDVAKHSTQREALDTLEQVLRANGIDAAKNQHKSLSSGERRLFECIEGDNTSLAEAADKLGLPFKKARSLFLSGSTKLISKLRMLASGRLPRWEEIPKEAVDRLCSWTDAGIGPSPVMRSDKSGEAVLAQIARILALAVPPEARQGRPPSQAEELARLMKDRGWAIQDLAGHLGVDVHEAAARLAGHTR